MQNHVLRMVGKLKEKKFPVNAGGFLNKNDSISLLAWADYVLIPSRIESIPVIFSDAIKCRCPVVSMPVGDLSRLVQENSVGILAKKVTSLDFANAIKESIRIPPESFLNNLNKTSVLFDISKISNLLIENIFR